MESVKAKLNLTSPFNNTHTQQDVCAAYVQPWPQHCRWFVDQLSRETEGETSTAVDSSTIWRVLHAGRAIHQRLLELYVPMLRTDHILEMTAVGQCDRYVSQGSTIRYARFGLREQADRPRCVRDFRKTYKNAPPRYIILNPDETEETIGWCDSRGISGGSNGSGADAPQA